VDSLKGKNTPPRRVLRQDTGGGNGLLGVKRGEDSVRCGKKKAEPDWKRQQGPQDSGRDEGQNKRGLCENGFRGKGRGSGNPRSIMPKPTREEDDLNPVEGMTLGNLLEGSRQSKKMSAV